MADPGDTSTRSAAATDDAHHDGSEAAATAPVHAPPPPPPPKVRLMVSYGGRIQPRPHDNQLAYVGGDTKILSLLERPLRFADFAARLAALVGTHLGDFCVKYQLPGEDLDALVSVTNDEDLEHLVIEYDRLHLFRPAPTSGTGSGGGGGSSRGSNLRLRVFLFPVQSPPPSGLLLDSKPERHWFVEALNTVPHAPKQETVPVPPSKGSPPQQKQEPVFAQHQSSSSPPQQKQEPVPTQQSSSSPPQHKQDLPSVQQPPVGPDYLFGLDNSFVPPPAVKVKVKDPAGDPREEIPADHVAVSPVVSPAEFHRQIQELEKLQVADNASNQPQPPAPAPPASLTSNGSDDSLTRAYPPATAEYYAPKFPEKPPVPPPSTAPTYLQVAGRYTSVAPGSSGAEHAPVFFIPAPHGYYATAASPGANSYPAAMYAVAPPNASGSNANGSAPSHGMSNATAYAPAPQVAYDSNGRAIYYTSVLPQYPSAAVNAVSAAGAVLGSEPAKPPVS